MKTLKKSISLILSLFFLLSFSLCSFSDALPDGEAKSLCLMEADSGRILYAVNEDEMLPPASVTKIMTLLLVMEALDEGRFALSDKVPVSARAAGMGGSQVYLEEGETMTVEEMIKCVVIASANDAAAALAEFVYGTLENFVARMNERALELGMTRTHFENTNGLDDTASEHLISAKDIAVMSAELLKHEKILDYTVVWQDSVRNGAFTLTNTNRLIRFYKGANGLKTGSTSKAGFCISATAKRDGMQLIAVVMGAPTRDKRNAEASKLLDYGFANYETYDYGGFDGEIALSGGAEERIALHAQPCSFVLEKGQGKKIEVKTDLPKKLSAPLEKDQIVGRVCFLLDGKEIAAIEIRTANEAQRISFSELCKKMFSAFTLF